MDLLTLQDKKIMVAGASSGIGQAAAVLISRLGGSVVLNGRDVGRLDATLSMLEGDGHHVMPFDLVEFSGIKQYVKDCVKIDGRRFDGLVFCAGKTNGAPIRSENTDQIADVMKANFLTYAALLTEFVSRKVLNDGGSIVALSSSATKHCDKSLFRYASSKAAVETASTVAANELSRRKIRVNVVLPEMTDTPLTHDHFFAAVPPEEIDRFYPLGGLTAMDVANTIIFLLSDMSAKITGQKFYLSAGNDGRPIDYIL